MSDGLDELLSTVAGVPCRFCHGHGSAEGACPDCGKPGDTFRLVSTDYGKTGDDMLIIEARRGPDGRIAVVRELRIPASLFKSGLTKP